MSSGTSERGFSSENIFKIEPLGFANRLDVEYERGTKDEVWD